MLDNKHYDSFSQAPTLDKQYMDLCFSHSLHQLAAEPTRTTERTKTLTNHVLTNSPEQLIQSGFIDMGLSDYELTYCARKMSLLKSNEHYKI